jgi:nicotinamide phosphoribosyltransferase
MYRNGLRIPVCLRADSYTISSDAFASDKARERSLYNFANRVGPTRAFPVVARSDAMVFYGLTEFYHKFLMDPCTHEDIDNSVEFMARANSMGGGLHFPEALWRRVVNEYGGYLPVRIRAIPEGTAFFPNEPVIEVESLAEGFGELAAHLEAVMVGMVSIASCRATLARHWYERILDYIKGELDDTQAAKISASYFIHDFGLRASSCLEEGTLLGKAHLLTFNGTDTFPAAYAAWKEGAPDGVGTSILALAHRNVQGYEHEEDCFRRMLEVSKSNGRIASYVADCYSFKNALKRLVELAKENTDCTIVVRPDSGPYVQNILDICDAAYNSGLITDKHPLYETPANLKFIQGDSGSPEKINGALHKLRDAGYGQFGIFGVGGYLRNACTRDTFSSAYKLAVIGREDKEVCKLSEIKAKMSIPGRTVINDRHTSPLVDVFKGQSDLKMTYYNGDDWKQFQKGFCPYPVVKLAFDTKRTLNRETYDFCYKAGFKPQVLSDEIEAKRTKFYETMR